MNDKLREFAKKLYEEARDAGVDPHALLDDIDISKPTPIPSSTRFCHNEHCQKLFVPRRRDQLHCSKLCADRCRICHRPYERTYNERIKKLRRSTHRGLPVPTER